MPKKRAIPVVKSQVVSPPSDELDYDQINSQEEVLPVPEPVKSRTIGPNKLIPKLRVHKSDTISTFFSFYDRKGRHRGIVVIDTQDGEEFIRQIQPDYLVVPQSINIPEEWVLPDILIQVE